jgi:hypothetical protein
MWALWRMTSAEAAHVEKKGRPIKEGERRTATKEGRNTNKGKEERREEGRRERRSSVSVRCLKYNFRCSISSFSFSTSPPD